VYSISVPPRITVVGSLNTDLVIRAPHLPAPGETVTGGEFATFSGGKGANQAVAAARLGARVAMVGCVGGDDFGRRLIDGLRADGVDVTHVHRDEGSASGTAFITVDPGGQNTIVVAPGANSQLTPDDVARAESLIKDSAVLLLQLETSMDTVLAAVRLASAHGVPIVLDPAPAPSQPVPAELVRLIDVINPNEIEARALTGVTVADAQAAGDAAAHLLAQGVRAVVIKLGARGAFVNDGRRATVVPGIPVDALDTTAAGDAFAGALAVGLAEGKDLIDAVDFANAAGALSVTRRGAQPSMPFRAEVDAFAHAG
jgi:ribokinase